MVKVFDFGHYKETEELEEPNQSDLFELKNTPQDFFQHYMKASHDGFLEGVKIFRNIIAQYPTADNEMKSIANRICVDLTKECNDHFKSMDYASNGH